MRNQMYEKMSYVLFTCPNCSRNLCVGLTSIGRSFNCPTCKTRVIAPKPEFPFPCPKCEAELLATRSAMASFFHCPACEHKIAVPFKDPRTEIQSVIQDSQKKPDQKKVATFVRREMSPGDTIPLPTLNKDSELQKKYEERISQTVHMFQQRQNRKSRETLIKALKIPSGCLTLWLLYYSLAAVFHPYIAAGLTLIAVMITVPLFFKAKWVLGDTE